MKKTLRMSLLLLSLLLALGSCKGGEGDSETTAPNGTGTQPTTESTAPAEEETTVPDPDAVTPYFPSLDAISFNKNEISATVGESIIVHRSDNTAYSYNAWPSMCRDENGVLYAVFSGDRLTHVCPYGQNIMAKSTDGGATWQEVGVINDSVMDDRDTGILYIGEGKMLITYFCHGTRTYLSEPERSNILEEARQAGVYDEVNEKLLDMEANPEKYSLQGNYIRISNDYGVTWEDPIKVPVSSPHGPILHSSGKLLYFGKISNSDTYRNGLIALFESNDQGKTWEPVSSVPVSYGLSTDDMWEPSLVELADGTLLGAIRVQNVVKDMEFTVYTCTSTDGGKSWTNPEPTGICGSPPHLMKLSDGSILLSYSRRDLPFGICARVSTDGGKSWSEEIVLASSPSADLGYPCTVELDDHTLVTVYYMLYESDEKPTIMSVRWNLN